MPSERALTIVTFYERLQFNAVTFNLSFLYQKMPQLLDVSHVSKRGSSLRITLPKGIREKLGLKEEDIVGFYEDNGNIIIKKIE